MDKVSKHTATAETKPVEAQELEIARCVHDCEQHGALEGKFRGQETRRCSWRCWQNLIKKDPVYPAQQLHL